MIVPNSTTKRGTNIFDIIDKSLSIQLHPTTTCSRELLDHSSCIPILAYRECCEGDELQDKLIDQLPMYKIAKDFLKFPWSSNKVLQNHHIIDIFTWDAKPIQPNRWFEILNKFIYNI